MVLGVQQTSWKERCFREGVWREDAFLFDILILRRHPRETSKGIDLKAAEHTRLKTGRGNTRWEIGDSGAQGQKPKPGVRESLQRESVAPKSQPEREEIQRALCPGSQGRRT